MRYHYEKPKIYSSIFGMIYTCNHPVYSICTLYQIGNKGLAVIQQRYNSENKSTYKQKSCLECSNYNTCKYKKGDDNYGCKEIHKK